MALDQLNVTGITSFINQNTGQDYLIFISTFIGLFFLFFIIDLIIIRILKKTAKKTKNQIDDFITAFLAEISWIFFAYLSFFIATQILTLSNIIRKGLKFILILFIGFYIAKGISAIINMIITNKISEKKKKGQLENMSMIMISGILVKIAIWSLIFLMVLSNIGIEITPMIAGLGVGGIAIALAAQTILSDLFSAFVIYFDKPFTEGDFIIIGSDMGVVEHIGIKTTRIKSLQGQQLVVSNSEMTSTRINNYKKMERRRVVFNFGVTYNTKSKKLQKIKMIVEDSIKKANTNFYKKKQVVELDRVHFKAFGASSLDFEVVYYVPTGDYKEYMDIQEFINLKLVETFEKEKISFAYPTQTIYLEK